MFPFHNRNASVAQWIEQCPPEACAAVRLRSDASNMSREGTENTLFTVPSRDFYFQKVTDCFPGFIAEAPAALRAPGRS